MNQESINPWSEFDSFKEKLESKDDVVKSIWKKIIQLFAYHKCLELKTEYKTLELDEVTQDWLKYHNEKFTILQYISINNISFILDKDILFFVRSEFHTNLEKLFDYYSSKINEFNPAIKDYLIELRDKNKSNILIELLNCWINEIGDSENYYYKTELFCVNKETEIVMPYILNEKLEKHSPLMLKLNFKELNIETDLYDILIKLNSNLVKKYLEEGKIELIISEKSEYYLIPIQNIDLIGESFQLCELSIKHNESKLILEIKSGKEIKRKEYDSDKDKKITELPSFHLWPNNNKMFGINYFASKTTTSDIWISGEELKKSDQLYFGKKENSIIQLCSNDNISYKSLGLLKLKTADKNNETISDDCNFDVVIDFGTSNTVVFFRNGSIPENFSFEECGSVSFFRDHINEFISDNPNIPEGGFSSLLFQNDEQFQLNAFSDVTKIVPAEFNIAFNSDYLTVINLGGKSKIKQDFKWSAGVPEGKVEISAFIYSLLLLICLKLQTKTKKINLCLTYPSAFSATDIEFYRNDLNKIVNTVAGITNIRIDIPIGNGEDWLVRESVAGAAYLMEKNDKCIVGIDIGGGTADFCFLENRNLKKEFSIKLAGKVIIEVFCKSEELLKQIKGYFKITETNSISDKSLFYVLLLKKENTNILEFFKANFKINQEIKKIRTAILILLYTYCKFVSIFIDESIKNELLSIYFMGNGSKFFEFLTLDNTVLKSKLDTIIKDWIGLKGGLNINMPDDNVKKEVVRGVFALNGMDVNVRSNFKNAVSFKNEDALKDKLFNLDEINKACEELELSEFKFEEKNIHDDSVDFQKFVENCEKLIKSLYKN